MAKQKFRVVLDVDCDIGTGISNEPYMTADRVRAQLDQALSPRRFNLASGLPCHGTSAVEVVGCIEVTPIEGTK